VDHGQWRRPLSSRSWVWSWPRGVRLLGLERRGRRRRPHRLRLLLVVTRTRSWAPPYTGSGKERRCRGLTRRLAPSPV